MSSDLAPLLEAARQRYADRRPRSKELFERATAVLPGGSTRSVLDVDPFAFRIASASGSRIVDVDGHEYIDFLGDYSAGLLGHDPTVVSAAVHAALDRGWSFGGVHVDEIRFAEAVCARFPSIEQVRFTNSGTEANLMAIQLARHHTGRDRIVVVDAAYHGGLLYFGHGGEALLAPFDFERITYNELDGLDRGHRRSRRGGAGRADDGCRRVHPGHAGLPDGAAQRAATRPAHCWSSTR